MSNIRVRFAPSPTGPLHIGNIRTALYNYLFSIKYSGDFILRIEDTDLNRSNSNSEKYILESLKWCNIIPTEGYNYGGHYGPYKQSKRLYIYKKYYKLLIKLGYAYYCFEDLNKLNLIKKKSKYFTYNMNNRLNFNNSLTLSKDKIKQNFKLGLPYVIRLKIPTNKIIKIKDLIKNNIIFNSNNIEDKILIKSNGYPTYHFANVIDDHLMNITHVIRGEEWISSTPIHIIIYNYFKWIIPKFAHLPLILSFNKEGKISKRYIKYITYPILPIRWINKHYCVLGYKELGYSNISFINIISRLGCNINNDNLLNIKEMSKIFNLNKINRSNCHIDINKAKWFNKKYFNNISDYEILNLIKSELNKHNLNYKYFYKLNNIINNIKKRIYFKYDIWPNIYYLFKTPKKYKKINFLFRIKNYKYILINLIKFFYNLDIILYNNILKNINKFSLKTNLLIKDIFIILRISLVGDLKGIDLLNIIYIIGKKECLIRIYNLYKFINRI